jgi:hypothetical protein
VVDGGGRGDGDPDGVLLPGAISGPGGGVQLLLCVFGISRSAVEATSALLAWLSWFRPTSIEVIPLVGVVFGFIGMSGAATQLLSFVRKPKEKMFWWYTHLGNLIGSYIAAWSAFSVVTLTRVIGNHWYVWLWPTMIGVPAIILTTAYYQRKFAPRVKTVT